MSALNYFREPWRHPEVGKSHVVTMTTQYLCNVPTHVATCECSWAACVRVNRGQRGRDDHDRAINAHWHSVIAEAEAVPA